MSLVMYNRNISYCKSCWCLLVQPSKEVHVSVTWSKVHWLSSIPSLEASGSNTSYCSNISPDGPRSCSLPTSHSSWPFHQRFLACLTSDPTRNSVLQLFTNKTLSLSFFYLLSYSYSNTTISLLLLLLRTLPSPLYFRWNLFLKHNISSVTSRNGYVFFYISH